MSFKDKKRIKTIQRLQSIAKHYMFGGVALSMWEKDGSSRRIALEHIVTHLDIYKLTPKTIDGITLEDVDYVYPDDRVLEAFFKVRHKWTLGMAVLCRDKTGKVYFVQEKYLTVNEQCNYEDIEQHLNGYGFQAFKAANEQYRLALCYCFIPEQDHEVYETHFNALVYTRDILSKMHTKWEAENKEEFGWYNPSDKVDYNYWFYHQKDPKYAPNKLISIKDTRSFNVEDEYLAENQDVVGVLHHLHPLPFLIPERYHSKTLYKFSNALFSKGEKLKMYMEVDSEKTFEAYQKFRDEYLKG